MTNLDKEQQRAVNSIYGPVLVLAGPGSGKTTVLTKRIKHMIEDVRINPNEILVITFSKKAATEMEERFNRINANSANKVYFGTFHAIFYSILRRYTDFDENSILTVKMKLRILRRVFHNIKIPIKDDAMLLDYIEQFSTYKNVENKEQYLINKNYDDNGQTFIRIFNEYTDICKKDNKLDFDDMLYMCRDLLAMKPEIRKIYQKMYKYILVDEFQDINRVQYEVLNYLAGENNNIFAVGDDDQSIYGFRGSKPELMKDFMNKKNCLVIDMNRNYRSVKTIIDVSYKLIVNNDSRITKKQIPNNQDIDDGFVIVENCNNALSEAEYVCEKLIEIKNTGIALENVAIIYRTSRCIELLKEKMNCEGILFSSDVIKDNYYESEWVKDVISYLRAALGDRNALVMGRIINKPERGLDRDIIDSKDDINSTYNKFISDLSFISNMSSYAAINYIMQGMGYKKYMYNILSKRGFSEEKIEEIIKELLEKSKMYENIREWLEYVDSISENSNEIIDVKDRVNMLTAHSSKGLEFDTVFIVGLQEGIFPHEKAITKEEIEEERRLLYVAMTRARRELYVIGRGEYKYGKRISRFIDEIK